MTKKQLRDQQRARRALNKTLNSPTHVKRVQKNKEYFKKNRGKYKYPERVSKWGKANKDRRAFLQSVRGIVQKHICFENYGGKCCVCGETNTYKLTLDHANNNGAEHRKEVRDVYRWAVLNNYPTTMQCLCWNDQFRKRERKTDTKFEKLHDAAMLALGGKCVTCGETDLRVLTVEHVLGGGKEHSKKVGPRRIYSSIVSGKYNPKELVAMCCSCNMSKGVAKVRYSAINSKIKKFRTLLSDVNSSYLDRDIKNANECIGNESLPAKIKFYMRTGGLQIPADDWAVLKANFDKSSLISAITESIDPEKWWPTKGWKLDDAKKDFVSLCNYAEKFEGKFKLTRVGTACSDYFHEFDRFLAKNIRGVSMRDTWADPHKRSKIVSGLFIWGADEGITPQNFRRYLTIVGRMPGQFRPSIAKYMYETYGGAKVLDPCSGWGDRLAGFWSARNTQHYDGFDPNASLQPGYAAQAKLYSSINPEKTFNINPIPFEDAKLSGVYDIAFTSPPYFDRERYDDGPSQSVNRYSDVDAWIHGFLHNMLEKCCEHSHRVAINIANAGSVDLIGVTRDYLRIAGMVEEITLQYPLSDRRGGLRSEPIMVYRH